MKRKAMFPGSFDPITYGHRSIIRRALDIFDKVYVAVSDNSQKRYLFEAHQRRKFVENMFAAEIAINKIEVVLNCDELTADFAKDLGVGVIVRGARTVSDFETEMMLASLNREWNHDLETIIMIPEPKYQFLSSTVLKEVVNKGAKIPKGYSSREVIAAMKKLSGSWS